MNLENDVKLKSGAEFKKGTKVDQISYPQEYPHLIAVWCGEKKFYIPVTKAHKYLTGFERPPDEDTLWSWIADGICETLRGEPVDLDGRGPDGCPSWMLALGLI